MAVLAETRSHSSDSAVLSVVREGRVGVLSITRPGALNALSMEVLSELATEMAEFESDDDIGAILIRGSDTVFSAGADIKESQPRRFPGVFTEDWQAGWSRVAAIRLPVVAAVNGYALGGGCELPMLCHLVIAGDTPIFGQPEIKLGVIPGMGGTQRLTLAVGKAKAADLLLTARMMDATEAERVGLGSRVVPADQTFATALEAAQTIAGFGRVTAMLMKETLNRSFETSLAEGLLFERRAFHSCYATDEQIEGMSAFAEKRSANFHRKDPLA